MYERTYLDRSGWASGPWDDEPDIIEWVDQVTGMPCMMRRGLQGSWCGYTGVSMNWRLYGRAYSDLDDLDEDSELYIEVHGGLTYAGDGEFIPPAETIPMSYWYFGFDCMHYMDLTPNAHRIGIPPPPEYVYRDKAYVMAEVMHLALQLQAIEKRLLEKE